MRKAHWVIAAILGLLLTGCAGISTAPTPEARQALAPTGKLRVGLTIGVPASVMRDSASGEMKGVLFDLGKELARRMEVPFEPLVYSSIGTLLDGAKSGEWDVAIFGVNPARAKQFDFTGTVLEIEWSYLVPAGSGISVLSDVDRPGVRVGVPGKSGVEAVLSRTLKNAVLVPAPGLAAGLEMLRDGKVDAFGTNKGSLFEMSDQLPGSRVLAGNYGSNSVAIAIPKGPDLGAAYARKFVEDAKSEGLVKAAIERAGLRGAVVAPLQ